MNTIFSYCSWVENDISSNIIDFVNKYKYMSIPKRKIDSFLREYHINYFELPQYLKDELDKIDVY